MGASDNVALLAFSDEQASRLTGVSVSQLRYWRKEPAFFQPTWREGSEFYSFRDLVGLRTIASLRKRVSLQELRKISPWLRKYHNTPWASLPLYLAGKTIIAEDPDTGTRLSSRPLDQGALPIDMVRVANEMQEAVRRDRQRSDDDIGQIEKTRSVMGNRPVVRGTRVPTAAVFAFAEEGATVDEIIEEYPSLTAADVQAAIEFEAQLRKKSAAG